MDYRAFVLTQSGLIDDVVILDCVNDAAALKAAQGLADGHDVQIWQDERLLGTISAYSSKER